MSTPPCKNPDGCMLCGLNTLDLVDVEGQDGCAYCAEIALRKTGAKARGRAATIRRRGRKEVISKQGDKVVGQPGLVAIVERLRAENAKLRSLDPTGWARICKRERDEVERLENKVASLRKQYDDAVIQHVAEVERLRAERATFDKMLVGMKEGVAIRIAGLEAEVDQLREALAPFAKIGHSIPQNWPGECRLRIDRRRDRTEYLCYHGYPDDVLGCLPTLAEWRKAAEAAEKGSE